MYIYYRQTLSGGGYRYVILKGLNKKFIQHLNISNTYNTAGSIKKNV